MRRRRIGGEECFRRRLVLRLCLRLTRLSLDTCRNLWPCILRMRTRLDTRLYRLVVRGTCLRAGGLRICLNQRWLDVRNEYTAAAIQGTCSSRVISIVFPRSRHVSFWVAKHVAFNRW